MNDILSAVLLIQFFPFDAIGYVVVAGDNDSHIISKRNVLGKADAARQFYEPLIHRIG
jgi:hypothetical protein